MAKQLINLVGGLAVVAALLGGVFLIALPLFSAAEKVSADAQRVEGDNVVFDAQLAALRADAERFDQIEADVAELRAQIPADTRADDVFEIVGAAAAESGVTVVSVTAAEVEAWSPRIGGTDDDGAADAAQAQAPASEPAATAAPAETPAPSGGTADTVAPAPEESAASPRTQVSFSIAVEAADPAQAVAFVDALGRGPRLLAIVHSGLTATDDAYDVTVSALTFVRADS
jgi:hypothetical protein